MSTVVKSRRRESKVEFDNTYFKIYDDCVRLIENHLGAKGKVREERQTYIQVMSRQLLTSVCEIGTHIRIANSIYPICQVEFDERRTEQEKAIGLCYDVLTKYQLIMHELKIPDDKNVDVIRNVVHEINCLKKWRTSDNKRKNVG